MSRSHNKKRNVGIIYEQLIALISRSLVENDKKTAESAIKIIKTHFTPGTELYKEFRLFNALLKTHVKSDALASRILSESKIAASKHNKQKLNSEKSSLIKEINYTFGKDRLYSTEIQDYKVLATIQSLLNDWRSPTFDVSKRVSYETKIHNWLMTEKSETSVEDLKTPQVNDLTVKIMRETFNKKFGSFLNNSQKDVLRQFVFDSADDLAKKELQEMMTKQVTDAKLLLREYQGQCDSQHVKGKIPQAVNLLESLDVADTSDQNIVKFLSVTRLCEELTEKNNE